MSSSSSSRLLSARQYNDMADVLTVIGSKIDELRPKVMMMKINYIHCDGIFARSSSQVEWLLKAENDSDLLLDGNMLMMAMSVVDTSSTLARGWGSREEVSDRKQNHLHEC